MATAHRSELEAIAGTPLVLLPRSTPEGIPTGMPALDPIPRGSLSEICGPASSGRTSVAISLMAEITAREEVCASPNFEFLKRNLWAARIRLGMIAAANESVRAIAI